MPDISDLATSDVVGFTGRGGIASVADGEITVQNDAGTNAFTIDVNGSAELQVVDNEIGVPAGGSFSVYNVGGPGDTNYERLRINADSNVFKITSEAGGTGTARETQIIAAVSGSTRFYRTTNLDLSVGSSIVCYRTIQPSGSNIALGRNSAGWQELYLSDRNSDPLAPGNGLCVLWQSDGTGSGDDGDIMMKITDSLGTTKTATLVDFSALP